MSAYKSYGYDDQLIGPKGPLSGLVRCLIEYVQSSRYNWTVKKRGYLVCTIEAGTGNVSVANLASPREAQICVKQARLANVEYDL